jgi:hypothetical protein
MVETGFSARLDRLESDIADMRSDVKALLAAHNMGKGFWFTVKVGAGITGAGGSIAAIWHYVFGHP